VLPPKMGDGVAGSRAGGDQVAAPSARIPRGTGAARCALEAETLAPQKDLGAAMPLCTSAVCMALDVDKS
jgi:hypothetical protein